MPEDPHLIDRVIVVCHRDRQSSAAEMRRTRDDIRRHFPNAAIFYPQGTVKADKKKPYINRGHSWGNGLPPSRLFNLKRRPYHDIEEWSAEVARTINVFSDARLAELNHRHDLDLTRHKNLILTGSSKGGWVASEAALRHPEPCLAGLNFNGPLFDTGQAPRTNGTPIFYAYGRGDEIIHPVLMHNAIAALRRRGVDALVHISPAPAVPIYVPVENMFFSPSASEEADRHGYFMSRSVSHHAVSDEAKRAALYFIKEGRENPSLRLRHITNIRDFGISYRTMGVLWDFAEPIIHAGLKVKEATKPVRCQCRKMWQKLSKRQFVSTVIEGIKNPAGTIGLATRIVEGTARGPIARKATAD